MIIAGTHLSVWFTRFGEVGIVLPMAVATAVWMMVVSRSVRPGSSWLLPLGIAALATTISKIAFIGWGVGIASIDFTGFSGHAMFSAAIYPVLAHALTAHLRTRGETLRPNAAVVGAYVFAALIAYSRIRIHAHSWSEVILGYTLGALASGCALWLIGHSKHRPPLRWAFLGVAGWLVVMPLQASPSRSHDIVTRVALKLADRQEPYIRADLHRGDVVELEPVRFY